MSDFLLVYTANKGNKGIYVSLYAKYVRRAGKHSTREKLP
jgi:hypothetical protein